MYGIFFLIGILFVGIISSYTDIKYGLIKNKVLLIGIIYAIILNIIIFFTISKANFSGYLHYFVNSFFMLGLGFLFWIIGLWTAGDAKLFFVLNLLTPPFFITKYYLGMFYGMIYFLNIFGVMFFYFTYKLFRNVTLSEALASFKKTMQVKLILKITVFIFSFGYLMSFLPPFLTSNFFLTMCFMFIFFSLIKIFFKNKIIYLFYFFCVLRLIFDFNTVFSIDFLKLFLVQLIVFILLRFFILRLSYFAFTKKVRVRDIQKGMFLAEDIFPAVVVEKNPERIKLEGEITKGKFTKKPIETLTFFSYLKNDAFKHIDYDKNLGISDDLVKWFLKQKSNLLFRSIRVYETMPFAPMIFIGFLVTLLLKGNIFNELYMFIISLL